ncbi:MAG: type II methionyl aminopeptidase [Candidatus Lokiarchaeota archaeon]|nr:type II methionyl aminopeptidase [Candidatus Lokiarchaeota archaeon]
MVYYLTSKPHPSHVKAGKIAARVRDEICAILEPESKIFTLCTLAEKKILEYGGQPAFPCTISQNHYTAHYTSPIGDPTVLSPDAMVKVDIGVHVEGYIVDTARTIDLSGDLEGFAIATDDALQEAIRVMRPGTSLGEIGKVIEKVIKTYGLKPIKNLFGHSIERYRLHAGKSVPNVKTRTSETVEIGECYAIEPYATNGVGSVIDSDLIYIFSNIPKDEPLTGETEKLRLHLRKQYGPFPFTSRWIGTKSKDIDIFQSLLELIKHKYLEKYPVQITKKGRPSSQSEHTVFISEDETIILTE